MARAKSPLDPCVVISADEALYQRHEDDVRPNALFDAEGNRKLLSPSDPEQADLRREWMDLYQQHGGKVEPCLSNKPPDEPCETCPNTIFLEVGYYDPDGHGIGGVRICIESPAYSTTGVTNDDGILHIKGVPEISGFEWYTSNDPMPYVPRVMPSVQSNTLAVKEPAVSTFDSVIDWIWGTVQGDFNDNQSTSQIVVNTIVGLIPIVDQVMDIRDIIAGLQNLFEFYALDEAEQEQKNQQTFLGLSHEMWLWLGLFLIAIGLIPTLGSAIKGVLKVIIKSLQDLASKAGNLSAAQLRKIWENVIEVLNKFGIRGGNASRWLKELPGKLDGWMDEAAGHIKHALDTVQDMLIQAKRYAKLLPGDTGRRFTTHLETALRVIKDTYKRLDQAKRTLNRWLKDQINKILDAKHNYKQKGDINKNASPGGPNSRVQKEVDPPEVDELGTRASRKEASQATDDASKLSIHDPAHRVMGSAKNSHPQEIAEMRRAMEDAGVEIIERPNGMSYNPGLSQGKPGQFVIDPDASYSAWLHEYQHYLDDKAAGWGGFRDIANKDVRWAREQRAYAKEIEFMRQQGHEDVVRDLEALREIERKTIYGAYD